MRCLLALSAEDVFDELFKLAPEKVNTVKEVRESQAPSGSPARLPRVSWGDGEGTRPPRLSPAVPGTPRGESFLPPAVGRRDTRALGLRSSFFPG